MFTCRHAPFALPDHVAATLATLYGEPHRAYHNATHVDEVLAWFDVVIDEGPGWQVPEDVFQAIVFHDAVYDPTATGGANEAASARLAAELAQASPRVQQLILWTAQHGRIAPPHRRAAPGIVVDDEAALFLDCDLAILGAEPAAFDAYDAAIAKEYAHVPPAAFAVGRAQFLSALMARPYLYLSPFFHDRLELRARANLTRALARY